MRPNLYVPLLSQTPSSTTKIQASVTEVTYGWFIDTGKGEGEGIQSMWGGDTWIRT